MCGDPANQSAHRAKRNLSVLPDKLIRLSWTGKQDADIQVCWISITPDQQNLILVSDIVSAALL